MSRSVKDEIGAVNGFLRYEEDPLYQTVMCKNIPDNLLDNIFSVWHIFYRVKREVLDD